MRELILTILFVLLKAFDKIHWSWWWVFSPLWVPVILTYLYSILEAIDKAINKKEL